MAQKSMKSHNSPKIWTFILLNIVLAYCFLHLKEVTLENAQSFYSSLSGKDSFVILISPLITLFLNNILSSGLKAKIVFWRIKNPLPGTRVFSKLINNDPRIDKDLLETKYGELPVKPTEQNKLWYKILKNNEENISINNSHRTYLLLRDITGISFFLLVLFIPFYLFFFLKDISALYFITYLIFQYIGFSICTHNVGNRFTLNVLAIDSLKP